MQHSRSRKQIARIDRFARRLFQNVRSPVPRCRRVANDDFQTDANDVKPH